MRSRLWRKVSKLCGVVLLVLLGIGGWGIWKWRSLSRPDSTALRAWDVAPDSTVYFYFAPDVPRFYSKFYKYHLKSIASPTLETANEKGHSNPVLQRKPSQSVHANLEEVIGASAEVALFDFFVTMLPPTEGDERLSYLLGGKCLNSDLGSWSFRRTLSKEGFKWSASRGNGPTLHLGKLDQSEVVVGTAGDWLLIADEPEKVLDAIRAVDTRGREALGSRPAFQESRTATLRESILWVYTDVPNLVASTAATGIPEAGAVLTRLMPMLKAASYGFTDSGPHGIGFDQISYTLTTEGAAAARNALPRVDPGFFKTTTEETLMAMTSSVDFGRLAEWPFLKRAVVEQVARQAPGSPSPVRQISRTVRRTASGGRETRWGTFEKGSVEPAAEEAGWSAAAGTLPGAPEPFIEIRFNYQGIVEGLMEELQADWPAWKHAGAQRGLPMPAEPPNFDGDKYFKWIRYTAGFEGNTLCVYTALRMGAMGTTDLTALNELTANFFTEEMLHRFSLLRLPFANVGGADSPDWANSMDVAYSSALFMSPIFTNHNGATIATSLITLDLLAGVTQPPSE
jgi:hypothetical protein